MKNTILVAGATGNLGQKITKALLQRGAAVRAVVRTDSDDAKVSALQATGVEVLRVSMMDVAAVAETCRGVSCVVSALQGLRDVIIDVQTVLLKGAVASGVQRFIPSDYALDFTLFPRGGNRNFDLRQEFHDTLGREPVRATSIYIGAFADILTYGTPLLDLRKKTVGYWGDDPSWHLDFTTMDDTARFTAAAAMDDTAPRSLHIASFQVTPQDLSRIASGKGSNPFKLVSMGSLEDLASYNRHQRASHPESERELYPKWRSGQYMHDMFVSHHATLDNSRYAQLNWTSAPEFIETLLST